MNKDNFEIELGAKLRKAEAPVPHGAWEAIQAGFKPMPGAAGTGFSFGLGLLAGAALLGSLALYSSIDSEVAKEPTVAAYQPELRKPSARLVSVIGADNGELAIVVEGETIVDEPVEESTEDLIVISESETEVESERREELPIIKPIPVQHPQDVALATSDERTANLPVVSKTDQIQNVQTVEVQAPIAKISVKENVGYAPFRVKFENAGRGEFFFWEFGSLAKSNEKSPEVLFEQPGEYLVGLSVSNSKDDVSTDFVRIIVKEGSRFELQNSFTPNGDGINDKFEVLGAVNISEFLLIITDERGDVVFETRDLNQPWVFDHSVHGRDGARYFATYKAVGIDGKIHRKNRMPLTISY